MFLNTKPVRIIHAREGFEMTLMQAMAKVKRWIEDQIVEDVPDEDVFCEYFCDKEHCRLGDWATCKRRLVNIELLKWKAR